MKTINMLVLFLAFSIIEIRPVKAFEGEAMIVEVRKSIALSKNDKVYKHFMIKGGTQMGLEKGKIVDVLRRVPIHDPIMNQSIGDIHVKVGELEIIQADPSISVAKLLFLESPEERPLLEFEAVMIGDRLDLGSIRNNPDLMLNTKEPQVAAIK